MRLGSGDGLFDIEANHAADLMKGDGKLILNRLGGNTEDLGDFAVAEAILFDKLEDDLTFWRELVDGLSDQRQHIGGDEELFGVEIDAGEFGLEIIDRKCGVTFLLVEIIEGDVAGADI